MNRRNLLRAFGGAAIAATSGGAVYAAGRARTPAQLAQRAAAPPPSTITAPVRRGGLANQLTLTGVFEHSVVVDVPGPRSVAGATRLIVTRTPPKVGQRIDPGGLLAEVSGRPVIAMTGSFPAYRDLRPGSSGPDVAQLRRALGPLYGTPPGAEFTARVASDVRRLYHALGYSPIETGVGPAVPMGEMAFLPSLPARVTAIRARIGTDAKGPLVRVGAGPVRVAAPVDDAARGALSGDVGVRFGTGPLKGATTRLLEIRDVDTGPQAQGPGRADAIFAVDAAPGATDLTAAQEVVLGAGRTVADAWIIPVAALWTARDGSVAVTTVDGDRRRDVPVKVLVSVRGEAAVDGDLAADDEVLVGVR
jgi:hypothetical protein